MSDSDAKVNAPWGPTPRSEFIDVKVRFFAPVTFEGMGGSEQLKQALWHVKRETALIQMGAGIVAVKVAGSGCNVWFPGKLE